MPGKDKSKGTSRKKNGGRNKKNGNNAETQSAKKTLLDHIYTLGNKQAIECVEVIKYLLNDIQEKYQFGDDIALALEEREAFDIKIHKPVKETVDATIGGDAKTI